MNDHELFSFDKPRKTIPEKELIRELQAYSRANKGRPISKNAYNKWAGRRFNGETISRYFGTWEDACRKAGVSFFKKHQYSDEELIEHCEAVWRWRGQRPVTKDFQEYNKQHGTTINPIAYARRWGSLKRFLRLFSQYKLGQITLEKLIESKIKSSREAITPQLRAQVLKRDNHTCKDCGASPRNNDNVELQIHHIVPVSKGGKTELSNLVTNCKKCNLGKSDRIIG